MLHHQQNTNTAWQPALDSPSIDRWLADRQQLLVEYCDLSSDTLSPDSGSECGEKLRHLCQTLIDYVSAGHFGVYDKLLQHSQDQPAPILQDALRHFSRVDRTTDPVLDFNDKYLETDDLSLLADDLSQLGEILESRFIAEDSMIAVVHRQRCEPRQLN